MIGKLMLLHLLGVLGIAGVTDAAVAQGENVALRGEATQSSIYGIPSASNAIDGDRDGHYVYESCSQTKNDFEPWWRMDLLKKHKVFSVTITIRQDCCSSRLNGAEIRIGDLLDNNGNNNPRCAVISIPAGLSSTFQCDGMEGRYVNVVIPGRREYLTLCEVEVRGLPTLDGENVTLRGEATQSSVYGNNLQPLASKAIDVYRDDNYLHGFCSHTKNDFEPWWRVDLLRKHKVFSVTITNRHDCCSRRLNGAEIRIGDLLDNNGNNNPRCAVISNPAGLSSTFQCDGMEGRYVNVVIPGRREYLTLCEVEVRGLPTPDGENVVLKGEATQSSHKANDLASKAIDGTKNHSKPWWVHLLKKHKVSSLTITRVEIRIGDVLDNNCNNKISEL